MRTESSQKETKKKSLDTSQSNVIDTPSSLKRAPLTAVNDNIKSTRAAIADLIDNSASNTPYSSRVKRALSGPSPSVKITADPEVIKAAQLATLSKTLVPQNTSTPTRSRQGSWRQTAPPPSTFINDENVPTGNKVNTEKISDDLTLVMLEMEKVMINRDKVILAGHTELKQQMKELQQSMDALLIVVHVLCDKLV